MLLKSLEIIENVAYTTADFIDVFLSSSKSNYLAMRNSRPSYRKTIAEGIRERMVEKQEQEVKKQKLYDLLHRLRKEGLIKKSRKDDKVVWRITQKGRDKKTLFSEKLMNKLPQKNYKSEKSEDILIVSFDIPEKERNKRDWLRAVLENSDFKILQKSVWFGRVKLPAEFLGDLKELGILDYVEIFSIKKAGTVKKIA